MRGCERRKETSSVIGGGSVREQTFMVVVGKVRRVGLSLREIY